MPIKVLVETGFLLSLNPRDKHHDWALNILNKARKSDIQIFISDPAILELVLILKSRGVGDRDIGILLESMHSVIRSYTKLNYAYVTFESSALASKLRVKYSELTFFDSYHAALTISNNLEYYDLDPIVKEVVSKERI